MLMTPGTVFRRAALGVAPVVDMAASATVRGLVVTATTTDASA
jgi:hypothetical protein